MLIDPLDRRGACGNVRNLPRVSRSIRIGDVVGSRRHLLLADREAAKGSRKSPEQSRHDYSPMLSAASGRTTILSSGAGIGRVGGRATVDHTIQNRQTAL